MKWLFLLLLAVIIFGGAAFFSYDLFVKPERKIQQEKSGEIPVEPVPDVALPDFQAAAKLRQEGKLAEARSTLEESLALRARLQLLVFAAEKMAANAFCSDSAWTVLIALMVSDVVAAMAHSRERLGPDHTYASVQGILRGVWITSCGRRVA